MIDTEFIKVPMERIKIFKEDDSKIIKALQKMHLITKNNF
jgi:rRNA processing protein Krr1/Pno1